jgi:hypothetical protein
VKEYPPQRCSAATPQPKQRPRIEDSESGRGSGSALSHRFEHEGREEHEGRKDFFRFDALSVIQSSWSFATFVVENISAQVLRPDE